MITLPNLPYAFSDFEPDLSARTLTFHYTKHHAAYVQKTNELIANTKMSDMSLSDIVLTSASDTLYTSLFNNAAQSFNHNFFWQSLSPSATSPTFLKPLIERDFKSLDTFYITALEKGLSQFASGWLWLVATNDKHLRLITTSNADTPLTMGNLTPLLCLDLWEHAYYLDYQNRRYDYLKTMLLNHLNWPFAESNFTQKFRTN